MNYYMPNNPVYPTQNNFTEKILFMEDILNKANKTKAKIYTTFSNSEEYRDKIFEGIIETNGKDYIIVSDPQTGHFNLIPIIFINYIEFEENILNNNKNI